MRRSIAVSVVAVLLGSGSLLAQVDAALQFAGIPPSGVVLLDTTTGTTTTIRPPGNDGTAGGVLFGPYGNLYYASRENGVAALNVANRSWDPRRSVTDPSRNIIFTPWQPAWDYDNVGGPALVCLDQKQGVSPAPLFARQAFRVDYSSFTPTVMLQGWYPIGERPSSDFFPDLYNPGSFVGVGEWTYDADVRRYTLPSSGPGPLTSTLMASQRFPSRSDATLLETGELAILADANVTFVDLRTGFARDVRTQGVAGGFGAIWSDPWERPGMTGRIVTGHTLFDVDLGVDPVVATRSVPLTLPQGAIVYCGRDAEECQLCAWVTNPATGARNFHLNFGRRAAGQTAYLAPSLSGLAPVAFPVAGLEIRLALDGATYLGLNNLLPYAPSVVLDGDGQADIAWSGLPDQPAVTAFWQAVTLGSVSDASNIIGVMLD